MSEVREVAGQRSYRIVTDSRGSVDATTLARLIKQLTPDISNCKIQSDMEEPRDALHVYVDITSTCPPQERKAILRRVLQLLHERGALARSVSDLLRSIEV